MQHNGPVNLVFTGLYVWVVPVTSGNLYCINYLSTGNRYRLYISLILGRSTRDFLVSPAGLFGKSRQISRFST